MEERNDSRANAHRLARAAIIYHYFENKADLIQSLYARVKTEQGRAMMARDDPRQPLAQRFHSLMLATFDYCVGHPQQMAFLEQYESLPMPPKREEAPPDEQTQALHRLWKDLRAQQLMKDLPDPVLGEFTMEVMRRLARQSATGLINVDEAIVDDIANACWDAIAR